MAKIVLFGLLALVLLGGGTPLWAAAAPPGAGVHAAATEEAGPGLFSGSFADSLWTVVAFVVLALVLGRVAWRPLLLALDARQNHIVEQLKAAEDSRQRAEHMLADYKQQGQNTVRKAAEEAQRHHQQMLEQTREEVLALRRRAHEEIESARATALEELWKQTGEIVLRVGSEVLGRTVSAQDNQRLIEEAVARIKQDGGL
jgi:F-type H+-transporting ATPase subunit b